MNKAILLLIIVLFTSTSFANEYDGPFVVTDFNFDKIYTTPQLVDFYCWPSNDIDTNCVKSTYYQIDYINYDYNFGDFALIDFDGTKEITVYAKNDLNYESNKTFTLTINKPVVNQPTNNQTSSGGGSGGVSYNQPNSQMSQTNEETNNEITLDINENSENDEPVNQEINNDLENQNYEENSDLKIEVVPAGVDVSIAGLFLFEMPELEKYSIYILLVAIVCILSIALVNIGKVKK